MRTAGQGRSAPGASEQLHHAEGDKRAGVYGQIDQRDPGLVIHVELLEGQGPGVLDEHPADHVDYNGHGAPQETSPDGGLEGEGMQAGEIEIRKRNRVNILLNTL